MDVDMVVTATEDAVSAQLRADDEEVTRVLQHCVCVCVCVCVLLLVFGHSGTISEALRYLRH
jgi:hypothetical protein